MVQQPRSLEAWEMTAAQLKSVDRRKQLDNWQLAQHIAAIIHEFYLEGVNLNDRPDIGIGTFFGKIMEACHDDPNLTMLVLNIISGIRNDANNETKDL